MKRKVIFLVLVIILLTSCQSEQGTDPAETTLRAYLTALEEGSFETALSYCTDETRDVIEFYDVSLERIRRRDKYTEIELIKQNSNSAVFLVKGPGYIETGSKFHLKKIGNDWRVNQENEIEQRELFVRYYLKFYKMRDSPDFSIENYNVKLKTTPAVIHVFVALCDNKSQGIVKVSKKLGDGSNPDTNLYWGSAYGIRAFFKRGKNWKLIKQIKSPSAKVLERVIFKFQGDRTVFLVADAYIGKEIRQCTIDMLQAYGRNNVERIIVKDNNKEVKLAVGGGAQFICYIGHNGLMDFNLKQIPKLNKFARTQPELAIFGCYSKSYFEKIIYKISGGLNDHYIIWTTNLLAPEAYVLGGVLDNWIKFGNPETLRKGAADAYQKYQKCNKKYADNLFEIDLMTGKNQSISVTSD